MDERLTNWIADVEIFRPEMDSLAKCFEQYDAAVESETTRLVGELPYLARFQFPDAVTTVRFLLKDYQTDSDVVITNLTTLPLNEQGKGYGSRAVQSLLVWAHDNHLNEVRATQVSGEGNESFWRGNGFEKCQAPNPCNDFVHVIVQEATRSSDRLEI